jgi:CHRD domain
MLKLFVALAAAVSALVLTQVAHAQERTTFDVPMSPVDEVPVCEDALQSGAEGNAMIQINEATGEIKYRVVATNLPATIAGGPGVHIHVQNPGSETGPVVQPLMLTGKNNGLVAAGTVTNPALAAAILADPANYYVNVHTTVCPPGAVRGDLG